MNLDAAHRASQLSAREREILERLARGDSIQEISTEFGFDDAEEGTIRYHVQKIIEKLQLRIRIQDKRLAQKERWEASEREREAR